MVNLTFSTAQSGSDFPIAVHRLAKPHRTLEIATALVSNAPVKKHCHLRLPSPHLYLPSEIAND